MKECVSYLLVYGKRSETQGAISLPIVANVVHPDSADKLDKIHHVRCDDKHKGVGLVEIPKIFMMKDDFFQLGVVI